MARVVAGGISFTLVKALGETLVVDEESAGGGIGVRIIADGDLGVVDKLTMVASFVGTRTTVETAVERIVVGEGSDEGGAPSRVIAGGRSRVIAGGRSFM